MMALETVLLAFGLLAAAFWATVLYQWMAWPNPQPRFLHVAWELKQFLLCVLLGHKPMHCPFHVDCGEEVCMRCLRSRRLP